MKGEPERRGGTERAQPRGRKEKEAALGAAQTGREAAAHRSSPRRRGRNRLYWGGRISAAAERSGARPPPGQRPFCACAALPPRACGTSPALRRIRTGPAQDPRSTAHPAAGHPVSPPEASAEPDGSAPAFPSPPPR